jgi:hypothetical protein
MFSIGGLRLFFCYVFLIGDNNMFWIFDFYEEWKAKKADKKRRDKIISEQDYLIRLRRSYREFCGTRYSTCGETLGIDEIRGLMLDELNRRTDT